MRIQQPAEEDDGWSESGDEQPSAQPAALPEVTAPAAPAAPQDIRAQLSALFGMRSLCCLANLLIVLGYTAGRSGPPAPPPASVSAEGDMGATATDAAPATATTAAPERERKSRVRRASCLLVP